MTDPRPVRINTVDLRERAAEALDSDHWRVYRCEWVNVYTVASGTSHGAPSPDGLMDLARDHFTTKYNGRVYPSDVRIDRDLAGGVPTVRMWLRLPTLKGEFKTRELAAEFALTLTHAQVVARNSKDDFKLRNYGVKLLPKGFDE